MTDAKIICTQVQQQFDYSTNKYVSIDKVIKTIDEERYNNMTSKEAIKSFRNLGGTKKQHAKAEELPG